MPKLLLLDEIDASLHPSMIKNLLNVIENHFLKNNISIILVTHSPSTIALSPEDSIFCMTKDHENRLFKSDKNSALSLLTEGFATIDEGLRLFGEVNSHSLCIFSEGHNEKYICKALELFQDEFPNILDKIHLVQSENFYSSNSSKEKLIKYFEFLKILNLSNKALFVYDCDAEKEVKNLVESKNCYYFIFERQNSELENHPRNGIENLFPSKYFQDEIKNQFYKKETKVNSKDGTINNIEKLDKKIFMNYFLKDGTKEDFENFKPLLAKIKYLLAEK